MGYCIESIIKLSERQILLLNLMKRVGAALLESGVYISAKVISKKEYETLKDTHFISTIKKEGVVLG
ncbi:MAG: hypothetical protein PQ975_00945 [Methanobacterium sp.]|jgi:hypothetical protein